MKSVIACSAIFLFAFYTCQSQNFDDVQIKVEHVRDSIYVLFGAGGNIGILSGEDGFVIVDDQFEPLATKIRAALTEISDEDVSFAINTHFHFDHADGNKAFGKSGTTIVAHKNTREHLNKDVLVEVPGFDTVLQEKFPDYGLPGITFESTMKLHLNNQTINIFHVDKAHTDSDVIVHFEESNVFHTGDAFVRYGVPFIDAPNGGSFRGMIESSNKLIDMCDDETLIIPGHGQISNKEDLIAYRKMLKQIWEKVTAHISDGKTLTDILDSNPVKEFAGDIVADYIVIMIYEEVNKSE